METIANIPYSVCQESTLFKLPFCMDIDQLLVQACGLFSHYVYTLFRTQRETLFNCS